MRRLGKHTTYEFQTHVELDTSFCNVLLVAARMRKELHAKNCFSIHWTLNF